MSLTGINPGRLDRRVILQMQDRGLASDGSVEISWISIITVSASWFPVSSREFTSVQSLNSEATGMFRIRFRPVLDTKWRLIHGNDVFDIVGVHEVGRQCYLDLLVKNNNGSPGLILHVELLHDITPVLLHDGSHQLLEPIV